MSPVHGSVSRPLRTGGPWQSLAGAVLAARRRWYLRRARRLPVPVVSIGNLHLGGSGKTPMVVAVAQHFRDRGRRVAVLSRGYRRTSRGVVVVSQGEGRLVPWRAAGDEPAMLADRLPGVAVIVGEDRYAAGRHALASLVPPPDLFVLDDGFSHLGLTRDLDLLVFPAADPWGNGKLAPTGPLREPLSAVARADAAVVSGLAAADPGAVRMVAAELGRRGLEGPIFASLLAESPGEGGTAGPVLLVTGIARPARVLASAHRLGLEVVEHLAFADHHRYPESSLRRIVRALRRSGAEAVLTTAKDAVKLTGRLDAPLRVLEVRADPEPGFWQWIDYSSPISKSGSPPSTD